MKYDSQSFEILKSSINNFKAWNGINAINWGRYFYKGNINNSLNIKITRDELLDYNFTNKLNNEEIAIAILSWGGMNREHGKTLFKHTEWISVVENLRNGQIKTRKEAYELFLNLRKNNKLIGMGPAYFTKLICFLNPHLNGYIMDQWTSKSINILFNEELIKLSTSGHVTDKNNSVIYENFCQKIEFLATKLDINPLSLEEQLFSSGGITKGKWRSYIVNNWNKDKIYTSVEIKSKITNNNLEPIQFDEVLKYLTENEFIIQTLGGKSSFQVKKENNLIVIRNSKNSISKIDRSHWEKVMARMDELPIDERGMTSRYGVGKDLYNWDKCPNKVFSLYIPAIVKHIIL
jgi:hypothetical protein